MILGQQGTKHHSMLEQRHYQQQHHGKHHPHAAQPLNNTDVATMERVWKVGNVLDSGCGVGNGLDSECGVGNGLDSRCVGVVDHDSATRTQTDNCHSHGNAKTTVTHSIGCSSGTRTSQQWQSQNGSASNSTMADARDNTMADAQDNPINNKYCCCCRKQYT